MRTRTRGHLATISANALWLIPQLQAGAAYSIQVVDLMPSGGMIDKEALWGFVPDIIPSTGEDSDDLPWACLAHFELWDKEFGIRSCNNQCLCAS